MADLKNEKRKWIVTVSSIIEAIIVNETKADALVVQVFEPGGHKENFCTD